MNNSKNNKTIGIRINKYLRDHKYATRLGADELIKEGKVTINGRKAKLGDQVTDADIVVVKNSTAAQKYVYYAYYKPRGITTHIEKNTKSILESTSFKEHVFPVGRLDKDSEGLIIMTNDGRITDKMLNPKYDHEKEYEVTVDKIITDSFISKMSKGVKLGDGYITKKCTVKKITPKIFTIILTEGKNRQIRRMCQTFGYGVKNLFRTRVINITIGNVKEGVYREINNSEKTAFLKLLGL